MKVKIGELKTHFSKYLRQLQNDGERIEVCVREDPVAFLCPIAPTSDPDPDNGQVIALARSGLLVHPPRTAKSRMPLPKPMVLPKRDQDIPTIQWMREEKDW